MPPAERPGDTSCFSVFLTFLQVNDAEREKKASAEEHRRTYRAYQRADLGVQELHKTLKRAVNKSK